MDKILERWSIRLNRNYIDVPIDKLIYILQFKLKHVFHCESMIAYHITRKKYVYTRGKLRLIYRNII